MKTLKTISIILILFGLYVGIMSALSETATIKTINGKDYVVAIDGKEIEPRLPTRYDLEMNWVYEK